MKNLKRIVIGLKIFLFWSLLTGVIAFAIIGVGVSLANKSKPEPETVKVPAHKGWEHGKHYYTSSIADSAVVKMKYDTSGDIIEITFKLK